jgi:hypothetical protein
MIPPHQRVAIPHLLLGKRRPETPVNFEGDPTDGSKVMPFRTGTVVAGDDTSHRVAIPHLLLGKRRLETPVNFEGDPTDGSKVMSLSNPYSGL